MPNPEPIAPPNKTKANKVRSEILCFLVFAKCLSYTINTKAIILMDKKAKNKIIIKDY